MFRIANRRKLERLSQKFTSRKILFRASNWFTQLAAHSRTLYPTIASCDSSIQWDMSRLPVNALSQRTVRCHNKPAARSGNSHVASVTWNDVPPALSVNVVRMCQVGPNSWIWGKIYTQNLADHIHFIYRLLLHSVIVTALFTDFCWILSL
jgi:hypothetical protein